MTIVIVIVIISAMLVPMPISRYAIGSISTCSQASCISNGIQLLISALIIIWLIYQLAMNIKLHRNMYFSWQQSLLLLILLCVVFNVCFSIWATNILWYLLSCLFFVIYFTTLVYYFSLKYLDKKVRPDKKKPYWVFLLIVYILFCLADLGCFIYNIVQQQVECKKIAAITIDGVMIVLGVVFFFLTYSNEHEQLSKFQQYQAIKSSSNPLRVVWVWVCCNIVGQIANQIQDTLILKSYQSNNCQPIAGNVQTDILAPVFLVLTYGISFCSTLWFYNRRRRVQEQSLALPYSNLQLASAQTDVENRLELLPDSNSGSNRTTIAFPSNYLS